MKLATVVTERLVLRALRSDDGPALHAIDSDARTHRFNPEGPPRSFEESLARLDEWMAHWTEHGFGYWAVEVKTAPLRVVGFGGLTHRVVEGETILNLYYRFAVDAWGHGYATELALAAVAFGRARFGPTPRVGAIINPLNVPSLRVAERAGLRRDRTISFHGRERLLLIDPGISG